jgi:hypothetical protein
MPVVYFIAMFAFGLIYSYSRKAGIMIPLDFLAAACFFAAMGAFLNSLRDP